MVKDVIAQKTKDADKNRLKSNDMSRKGREGGGWRRNDVRRDVSGWRIDVVAAVVAVG